MSASKSTLFQLSLEECRQRLTSPQPPVDVVRPCTPGDGVEQWSLSKLEGLAEAWVHSPAPADDCGLWIPASGAATRMFSFLQSDSEGQSRLWQATDRLAFGAVWRNAVEQRFGAEATPSQAAHVLLEMFDGGSLPKGLVPFHRGNSEDDAETPFQAHVRLWNEVMPEGSSVWFTVQESRRDEIARHLASCPSAAPFHIHLPVQDPLTDLPMLDAEGEWMKNDYDEVAKRPGGHGSLLPLLEEVTTSFLVIRNIDNAPSPVCFAERKTWTKAMLAEAKAWSNERKEWLDAVKGDTLDAEELLAWLARSGAGLGEGVTSEQRTVMEDALSRPMRLVGVVRNEGQPGGGPFWTRVAEGPDRGRVKPQIVEAVEFSERNADILASATHFNPVDMVCVLNPGEQLGRFVDSARHLQSTKSFRGEDVRVLEHPGLWNGGMSGWLTRFVEIPGSCFQPVKTALDLIGRV